MHCDVCGIAIIHGFDRTEIISIKKQSIDMSIRVANFANENELFTKFHPHLRNKFASDH